LEPTTGTSPSPSLVLGIDTGGTYTDGVLLEYHSRRVVASHKSLTTRRDLSIGIEKVIDGIRIERPAEVQLVSVSTTLATNAIAEGKGKRVALLLIGYDPGLIASFKMAGQFATPHYHYFAGGHDLYGREKEALDLPGILAKIDELRGQVDAIAVSSYFSPLNPEHENRVYQAASSACDLPIVLGHQLSTRLGSVERATTAALNASLLAALQDFVVAVRQAMGRRQIDAPLMVVRGDGTLMSDRFASRTPVETIHSGPAASAIGGRFLSGLDDALVVDIGGTTTDVALVRHGEVAISDEGASVGSYKTCVKAAHLLSVALGGDSAIAVGADRQVSIGPQRVVPLAYLASQFPQVQTRLKALSRRTWTQASPEALEYWYLLRDPEDDSLLRTAQQRALVAFLSGGPQPLPEIVRHLNLLHAGQISADELLRQEVVGKAGLTPTDLLHVEGRFAPWDGASAGQAAEALCRFHCIDPVDFRRQVWSQMTRLIVGAIVTFLTGRPVDLSSIARDEDLGHWFFENSLNGAHPQLETCIRLRQPMIGIGAPAAMFLPAVADALHTDLVLPSHYEVANAVGAVAGSVMAKDESLVVPHWSGSGLEVTGYYVQTDDSRDEFDGIDAALAHARAVSRQRALEAALRSGADHPEVIVDERPDGLDTYRVQSRAFGNPRLGR